MKYNNIFWHICALNNWQSIVLDQYNTIINSGLIDDVQNIYITFLGENPNDISWLLEKNSKILLHNYSTDYKLYEKLCLDSLHSWSMFNNSNILYIHAKGVSHPTNVNVWNWRKMMEYFLIDKYKQCIDLLNNFDTIGCILINHGNDTKIKDENHKFHFSGNFWWTTTKYIKILPPLPDIDMGINNNYWLCERWILYHYPKTKIFVPFQGNGGWYYNENPTYINQ